MGLIATPVRALIDQPVLIQVDGLAPGGQVAVRARLRGYGGVWMSEASFVADAGGSVDLSRDPPVAGSYEGVDAMGLFWSMRREPGDAPPIQPTGLLTAVLTAEVAGEAVASASVERLLVPDGVVRTRVRDRGLVGTFFDPPGAGPHPTVLVVGGSGGGLGGSFWQAAVLAGHGFAALALAYFHMESLPHNLVNIPLEYFETALNWLAAQPGVDSQAIGLIGMSRGGELALLLSATYPSIRAVIGYVPSHVVWRGFGRGIEHPAQSWTLRGEPVPMMRRTRIPTTPPPPEPTPGVPYAGTPGFLRSLEDREAEARAAIPVERINGPVLLISGQDDAMWPSTLMAERAAERLAAHHHPHRVEHLAYPGAGHVIYLPHLPVVTSGVHPVNGTLFDYGGSPRDTAHANVDSWPRVVAFLGESLRPVPQAHP